MSENVKFNVITTWSMNRIAQRVIDPTGRAIERIIDLQEHGVREALIGLGWTPPPPAPPPSSPRRCPVPIAERNASNPAASSSPSPPSWTVGDE